MCKHSKKYDIEELAFLILTNEEINKKYFDLDENGKLIYKSEKDLEKSPSFNLNPTDLPREIWKVCKDKNNKIIDENLKISNLGRLKYNNSLLRLAEKSKNSIGYLQIHKNDAQKIILKNNKTLWDSILAEHVYELVAYTFLKKNKGNNFDVHHINNDGYDNSVENLMFIDRETHNKIHQRANNDTTGKIKRTIRFNS